MRGSVLKVVWLQLSNLCLDHVYCVALFFFIPAFPNGPPVILEPIMTVEVVAPTEFQV